jgi:hypothetical protein
MNDLSYAERRNITQPAAYWDAFQRAADCAGMPLSEWLGAVALAALPPHIAAQLPARRKPGRYASLPSLPVSILPSIPELPLAR